MNDNAAGQGPLERPVRPLLQGGMNNAELLAAWMKKLPGVEPSERELSAFAVGVEVGFEHARRLERMDWDRVHHALKDAGVHPGRTDDHLADVIAAALKRWPREAEDRVNQLLGQVAAMELKCLRLSEALRDAAATERERLAKVCEAAWEIDGSHTAAEFAAVVRVA